MYGRRLRESDFISLINMKSIAEVTSFLKEHPGWAPSLMKANSAEIRRGELESALHDQVTSEYIRIYKFMSRDDHHLMSFLILRAEGDEILKCLRSFAEDSMDEYVCTLPEYFRKSMPVDFLKLAGCTDFDVFWEAISASSFFPTLSRLPRDNEEKIPDYPLAKVLVDTQYFSSLMNTIEKKYSGDTVLKLKDGLGSEIDLLNIVSIVRIKRYFPNMSDEIADYLLPLRHRIRPALLREMMKAPSSEAVIELLGSTPYRRLFSENSFGMIDDYVKKHIYEFNRRVLTTSEPSVYTPLAYISLKENEAANLTKIIECVRYGISPGDAGIYLPGITKE